jgi:hypothetical protein
MNGATKETTNFIHYKAMVIDAAGVTFEAAKPFASKIERGFDAGEPVWMMADELKLFCAAPRKMKTAKELAVRFVRA